VFGSSVGDTHRLWPAAAMTVALAAALGPGCAAVLTTLGGPAPRPAGASAAPAPGPAAGEAPEVAVWRDVRVIVHCHTWRSHDSDGADDEVIDAARAVGAKVVLLTDHPSAAAFFERPPPLRRGVLLVPGLEVRCRRGSVLVLGNRGAFPRGLGPDDLVREAHARGAVAVLAHAERFEGEDPAEVDAVEVHNLHADARDDSPPGLLLRALVLPPGAFFSSLLDGPAAPALERFRRLSATRPRAAVAGNDSHRNIRLFGPLGGAIGTYEETFRVVSTHVLLAPGPVTEEAVLDAIRAARTYVAFELDADPTGFRFEAQAGDRVHPLGSRLPFRPGEVTLRAEAADPEAEIALHADGRGLARGRGRLVAPAPGPGVYHVEVRRDDRLWVLSSPILLDPSPSPSPSPAPSPSPPSARAPADAPR